MADLVSEKKQDSKRDQKRYMYYDRNARNRTFKVGNEVLVLLPRWRKETLSTI